MRTIHVLPVVTTVLIGLYFAFSMVVANCTGTACDAYISISLLLPFLILVMVAITGISAAVLARAQPTWFASLLGLTALGVLGPPGTLLVFRDEPDVLVPVATVLELAVAITVFGFSLVDRSKPAPSIPPRS